MNRKQKQQQRQLRPAAVFHPAAYIVEELEAREWSRRDLAEAIGRPLERVNALLDGAARLTGAEACNLERAWGISAQFWMTMQLLWNRATPEQRDAGGIRG
jgi:plasmid maintenance system antidote protein VapI